MRKLKAELNGRVETVRLYGDNQSALALMRQHTPGASGRTKHIDVAYMLQFCDTVSCKETSKLFSWELMR